MPETAPQRNTVTITYTDGRVEEYDMSAPRILYTVNRLGVADDDLDASFFMFWVAAGKPGTNGGPLTIENARPALEAWLEDVAAADSSLSDQSGPPTKRRAASRGSAA
jgi:hypothetical protein